MNTKNQRHLRIILGLFVLSYGLLLSLVYLQTEEDIFKEAEQQAQDMLLTHRALHSYIETVQKPVFYELKQKQSLYQEYFDPRVLSFTYIARNVKDFLNQERREAGKSEVYFKLASDNPRNPINQADDKELQILQSMNEQGLSKLRERYSQDGEEFLYLALPIKANTPTCLRCHGDPAIAPKELIEQYGDKAGFYEEPGRIRAMISVRVPLKAYAAKLYQNFYREAALAFVLFSLLYLIIWWFFRRIDQHEQVLLDTQAELQHLASTDSLTQLANRHRFTQAVDQELARSKRRKHDIGFIMIDIDHFKHINDQFGHAEGDRVLQVFAERMRTLAREIDVVARLGGEEFMIMATESDAPATLKLAQRLQDSLHIHALSEQRLVTASFGVTCYQQGDDLDSIHRRADEALYRAKALGRDRIEVYENATQSNKA